MDDHCGNWTNYSDFERSHWLPRLDSEYVTKCKSLFTKESCTSKAAMKVLEKEVGGRYSVLMELPYFQPIKFSVIDPMHNLFLGTGKHMMEVWLSQEVLTPAKLLFIEESCQKFVVPDGIGRLPSNIYSTFVGFTADQWKNWITIFSPVLLRGCIPNDHWCCWMLFVRACTVLSSQTLRVSVAEEADARLLSFCKKVQELYGDKACSINMHLHLHLFLCIKDYGPTNGFDYVPLRGTMEC